MANLFDDVASSGILKQFYADSIVDQFNEDMPVFKVSEKVKNAYSGQQVQAPVRVLRNQGIGATTDGGLLPSIGRQTTVQATINPKYNYLRAGITAGLIKSSKQDIGSFVRGLDYEIKFGYKDLSNDLNRQLEWNGDGNLGLIGATVVGSNVITVIGREGLGQGDGNQFISATMQVDIVSSAGIYKAQNITINSITGTTTATATLNQVVTCAANDLVVRSGSYNNEVQGLLYALDGGTSTIYSVNRSTYTQYQGNVLDLAAAQLNLDAMQRVYIEGLRRGGSANGKYSMCLMDYDTSRFYAKLLVPDKRYVNTMQTMDGGAYKSGMPAMESNGIALVVDKDMPRRVMYIPQECLVWYELCSMELANETGSNLIAAQDNDIFEMRFRFFGNLFNKQPSAFGVLKNYVSP